MSTIKVIMIATFRFPKNWVKFKEYAIINPEKEFYCVSNGMPGEFCNLPNLKKISRSEALDMSFDIGVLFSEFEGSPNVLGEYVGLFNLVVCHDYPGDSLNLFIPGINALCEYDLSLPVEALRFKLDSIVFRNEVTTNVLKVINLDN